MKHSRDNLKRGRVCRSGRSLPLGARVVQRRGRSGIRSAGSGRSGSSRRGRGSADGSANVGEITIVTRMIIGRGKRIVKAMLQISGQIRLTRSATALKEVASTCVGPWSSSTRSPTTYGELEAVGQRPQGNLSSASSGYERRFLRRGQMRW